MKNYITFLLLALLNITSWGQNVFDPNNPQEPGTLYTLTLNVSPANAGYISPSAKAQYIVGQKVSISAQANTNYRFIGWKQGDNPVTEFASFEYTIPSMNSSLTACFVFDPLNPKEPDQVALQHTLAVSVTPSEGGYSNIPNGMKLYEGKTVGVQAYPRSNFVFAGWKVDNAIVSTNSSYLFTMDKKNVNLVATFRYDPINPEAPNQNSWSKESGELIIDHFTPGYLSTAIQQKIGSDWSLVLSVKIYGEMNAMDLGVLRNFSNCMVYDLSRVTGVTSLPSWSFYNLQFSKIILPSTINMIGDYAFGACPNLSEIISYAMDPPSLGWNVFNDIQVNTIVRVIQSSISKYLSATQWNQLDIFPLLENVGLLEVSLPASASNGKYKSKFIELVHTTTAQKIRLNVTEKMKYTFAGLVKDALYNVYMKDQNGIILGEINGVKISENETKVTFENLIELKNVRVNVCDGSANRLQGASVRWYNATHKFLQQGDSLCGQVVGDSIYYLVELNNILGEEFVVPKLQSYKIDDKDNAITVVLSPIDQYTIQGSVMSKDGTAISGAMISFSQLLNGKYSKSTTVKSDKEGKYSALVYNDQTTITYSSPNYVSQTVTKENLNEGVDLGVTSLEKIDGVTITTNLTYRKSLVINENETPKEEEYTNGANITYTLYNKTKESAITHFSVQPPTIVLLEEATEGDKIEITATSRISDFVPTVVQCTIDSNRKSVADFHLTQQGGINVSYITADTTQNVGILYNATGQLIKRYSYMNKSISASDLKAGVYTLVSMASSRFFSSILNLSELASSGLVENKDYVIQTVTVKDGELIKVAIAHIPQLDESKLYYTGDNTCFSVNKTSITVGNYLTMRCAIDFKESYSNVVRNVKLVIDIPEECTFVKNSIMLGNSLLSGYSLDGGQLVIPLNSYKDVVRFCMIPTRGGNYAPSAYVEFDLDEITVRQPIGAATFVANDLTITVPEKSSQKQITVSGTAQSNANILVYDNDVLVGQTKAMSNGKWSLKFNLYNPFSLSFHTIYAEVKTKEGLNLVTESKPLVYNSNEVMLSKVTMINVAHGSSSLGLCEYHTIFDFKNNQSSSLVYWYWPLYPEFTFKVEFANENIDQIENVSLNALTSAGNVVPVPLVFDKKNRYWIGKKNFGLDNLPINVNVLYSCLNNKLVYKASDVLINSTSNKEDHLSKIYPVNTKVVSETEKSRSYSFDLVGEDKVSYQKTQSLTASHTPGYKDGYNYSFINIQGVNNENQQIGHGLKYTEDLSKGITISNHTIIPKELVKELLENIKDKNIFSSQEIDDIDLYLEKSDDYFDFSEELDILFDKDAGDFEKFRDLGFKLLDDAIDRDYYKQYKMQQSYFDELLLKITCMESSGCVDNDVISAIKEEVMKAKEVSKRYNSIVPSSIEGVGGLFSNWFIVAQTALLKGILNYFSLIASEMNMRDVENNLLALKGMCPDCLKSSNSSGYYPQNATYLIDPSGYVYEAVPSNRLPGVTTTVYYKTEEEDMYGDKHEKIVLWDAENYEQENPLITDENGMYAWDVPQGMWQVKYEKEGYQTTYSEWLPVPPPQLEVNIGMVQSLQPEVKEAKGYESGIEVVFDKYMLPSLLTTDYITVTRNDKNESGTILFMNEESDSYSGKSFVSAIKFIPESSFDVNDNVVININHKVKSYANVMMENDFKQSVVVEKEASALTVDSNILLAYNEEKQIELTAAPVEAVAGKVLTIRSASPSIVMVPEEATFNEDGKAKILIRGDLPGNSVVSYVIKGGSLKANTLVTVEMPENIIKYTLGDSNTDGEVDVLDIVNIVNYIIGKTPNLFDVNLSDMNGDEQIDIFDVVAVVNVIINSSSIQPIIGSLNQGSGEMKVLANQLQLTTNVSVAGFDFAYTGALEAVKTILSDFEMVYYVKNGQQRVLAYTYKTGIPAGTKYLFSCDGKVNCSDLKFVDRNGNRINVIFDNTTTDNILVNDDEITIQIVEGILYVKPENIVQRIELFDLYGVGQISSNSAVLNVSTLPTGVYVLRVTTESGIIVRKIEK